MSTKGMSIKGRKMPTYARQPCRWQKSAEAIVLPSTPLADDTVSFELPADARIMLREAAHYMPLHQRDAEINRVTTIIRRKYPQHFH